jgi:hypothetical protein
MKYIILDCSNDGVIYVGESLAVVNQLKAGLVDTEMRLFFPRYLGYQLLNRNELFDETKHVFVKRDGSVTDLPESAHNTAYLERKRLIKIRAPLMEMLMRFTTMATQSCRPTIWEGFENNLEFAIRDSEPANNFYSDAIQEYAQINNVEPAHAYREIKLHCDNIHSIKMRVYSFLKHFADKINLTQTADEAKVVAYEIENKFFRDTLI